jgi:S1-C subfamily serine protease
VPLRIQCSSCQMISQVPDDSQGKAARCPKCGLLIKIPVLPVARPIPPVAAASSPATRPPAQPAKPSSAVTSHPHLPAAASVTGPFSFGLEPASARQDERKAASSNLPWISVAIGGGFVLVIGIIVAAVTGGPKPPEVRQMAQNDPKNTTYYPKEETASQDQKAVFAGPKSLDSQPEPAPSKQDAVAQKEEIKPSPKVPTPPPKQVAVPPGPTPPFIDPAATARVKKATAYFRVTMSNGQVAQGSGFFALEPGLVFTNAHVLGMMGSAGGMPSKVEVVVHSGQPEEFTCVGQVLGVDRINDLGIVRVEGPGHALPDPLPVDSTKHLIELQKVYIVGFPFGYSLGKEVTLSESSISTLRKDPSDGTVNQVQVNGGMEHGNSGGPVVDARGVVIGVAVAGYDGTQIKFAVPGEKVHRLLRGHVADIEFGEPYLDNGQTRLPLQITCIDPLSRLHELTVDVWTGESGPGRHDSSDKPATLAGDGPRQAVSLVYQNGQASAEVPMPSVKAGKVFWIQPVLIDGWGGKHWSWATAYKVSTLPPVERKPAMIQQNFDAQGDRTVKWTCSNQWYISKLSKQPTAEQSIEVAAVEKARKDSQGGLFNLFLANTKLSSERSGQSVGDNNKTVDKALELLRGKYATFVTDPTGSLLHRNQPTLNPPNSNDLRRDFAGMSNEICKSYEMTCLAMPNRQVAPKETWPAVLLIVVPGEGKAGIVSVPLTCTYEGLRRVQGRTQAMIAISGSVRSRQTEKKNIIGKVSGKVHFAVDMGYVSDASVKVEMDAGANGYHATHVIEVSLTRSPGNSLGVVPTPPPPTLVRGKVIIDEKTVLDHTSPANQRDRPGFPYRLYSPSLTAGTTYMIEMNKTNNDDDLDPYLVLYGPNGQKIAEDDDGGGDLDARIVFQPTQTGVHQIYATTFERERTGSFRLIISEISTVDAKTAKGP